MSEGASNLRFVFDDEPPPRDDEGVQISSVPWDVDPSMTDLELVADIWAADAREARYVAERAVSVAAFARRRRIQRAQEFAPRGGPGPDSRFRQPAFLDDFSETLVPELAMIRCCSEFEAEQLLVESLVLVRALPGTWGALYEGRIDVRKMRALVDLLGSAKPEAIEEIERRVLPRAGRLTVAQLRERVRRMLARLDAGSLEKRRAEAARRADVRHQAVGDGMGQLVLDMQLGRSLACFDAIRQHAEHLRAAGDTRPMGMLRSDVAADLILRPWDDSRPAVTAQLVIHAPLTALAPGEPGTQPAAEISGEIVTAAQCRELLEELDMLGVRSAPASGCVRVAVNDPATGRLVAVATRNELRRGGLGSRRNARHRRRRLVGAALATEASGMRRTGPVDGPGLRPPPDTSAYRPTAAQQTFVRVRDRHCRMPGCRRRAGRCDTDHSVAHADGGPTACWNLCCLCRRHHRIKTFARNWHFELLADGQLVVRTPSGVSRVTRPPGWAWDPEPNPPWVEEEGPPDGRSC